MNINVLCDLNKPAKINIFRPQNAIMPIDVNGARANSKISSNDECFFSETKCQVLKQTKLTKGIQMNLDLKSKFQVY